MRFSVFTHVEHVRHQDEFLGYAPYIREMNLWIKNVKALEVVAPKAPEALPPPASRGKQLAGEAYNFSHINFTAVPSLHILNFSGFLKTIINTPVVFINIFLGMQRSDHIHLRCPGNIGLFACICQIFFPYKPKTAKYAGNWDPAANQPWSYKIQKWILSNTFLSKNIKVLVYGDWPSQSKNILPFFTASFPESEKFQKIKDKNPPYKFLFAGNLVKGKQPEIALQIVEGLLERNIDAVLHVYGDGELMDMLSGQAKNKDYIQMHGNQPLEVLKKAYKESHFLILASKSEGWPKAVAEAMFFGCIPIATEVSCVPWMLGNGSRGILIPQPEKRAENREKRGIVERGEWKEDSQHVLEDTVEKIIQLTNRPEEMKRMAVEAQEWSQQYTLERFEEAIKKVLHPSRSLSGPKGKYKQNSE